MHVFPNITISEKRRIATNISEVDRIFLVNEYDGLVDRFDFIKSRFERTHFITKTDENWLDVVAKHQKYLRSSPNFRNRNS